MRILTPVVLGLLAGLASAQNLTAHPQQTLQNGNGNLVPFGVSGAGNFAEGRSQILVPKNELPSLPALLTDIEIHGQGTAVVDYASLTITLSPTTATQLSSTFAANVLGAPTVVLQASNLVVNYTGGWVRIPFSQPYFHDGTSGLLIEVQKIVQPGSGGFSFVTMSSSSSPARTDRPAMIYAFGNPGSGASNATNSIVSTISIVHRLVWQGTPTLRNQSDTTAPSGNQYAIGGQVSLFVQGTPGELWVLAAALSFLPSAVPVPGFAGELRLNGAVVFASGLLGAIGEDAVVLPLPNDPALVGFYLVYQAATVDPASGSITLTNGTDHFVNA